MVSKKTSDSLGHALAVYFSEIENSEPLDPKEEIRQLKERAIKRLQHATRVHLLRGILGLIFFG